jgi:DNA-binding CsgD family transcriptional regulator/tetratricopeptide (TPR) repeat protein
VGVLLDRTVERAALDDLIRAVQDGSSRTCVLIGDAGMGKTRLLQYAAESASEAHVAWISGFEAEAELGYAALHRLLRPLERHIERLPTPQRAALDTAFGLEGSALPDRFRVGLAALSVLADVASEGHLLCIIDDAQWVDRESLAALSFVARRLHADHIGLLFGVRDVDAVGGLLDGLPTLPIGGLPPDAALELLAASVDFVVDPDTGRRIVAETNGCPLALRELATALTQEQLRGGRPFDAALPIGRQLEEHFQRQVRALERGAQLFLLVAATESAGDPTLVRRAAAELGAGPLAEDAAVDSGLLSIDREIAFRHSLVRTAIYGGAPKAMRRRVHEQLAALIAPSDPDRRLLHLAAAAHGPDEALAAELEAAGARAARRGGYAAEASVVLEAANLSPSSDQRARRLLRAATAALDAGLPHRAKAVLEQARADLHDPLQTAEAIRLEGRLSAPLSRPSAAPKRLYEAAKMLLPLDRGLARVAFLEALEASVVAQHLTVGVTPAEIAAAALATNGPAARDTTADLVLEATAHLFLSDFDEAIALLQRAVPSLRAGSVGREEPMRWFNLILSLANESCDDATYNAWIDTLEQRARADGALIALQEVLLGRAGSDMRAGRFRAAELAYDESIEVTRIIGGFPEFYQQLKADLYAWRGQEQEARAAAKRLRELALAAGTAAAATFADIAVGTLELGIGRYEDALTAVEPAVEHNMPGWTCLALPIAIEGAARSGRTEVARRHVDALAARAIPSGTDWALGQLARCRALVDDVQAEKHHREAIERLARTAMTVQLAQARLAYGEWLRREHRRVEARAELRAAHDMFSTMGAEAFAGRARAELLATGERVQRRGVHARQELTAQEARAARLAADGATNAEIAAQMFISANTVDYHLRKVYRKLDVSSRRELSRVLPTTA